MSAYIPLRLEDIHEPTVAHLADGESASLLAGPFHDTAGAVAVDLNRRPYVKMFARILPGTDGREVVHRIASDSWTVRLPAGTRCHPVDRAQLLDRTKWAPCVVEFYDPAEAQGLRLGFGWTAETRAQVDGKLVQHAVWRNRERHDWLICLEQGVSSGGPDQTIAVRAMTALSGIPVSGPGYGNTVMKLADLLENWEPMPETEGARP